MTYSLKVIKVCGFNGSEPYSDYNRQHSRHIHLIYVQTDDPIEPASWAYRSLCHLDEKQKICLETQMSDRDVSAIQQWLREN
ncbi:hypothetical protein QUB05_04790 [Microcoleus sp. F10-C6]|jgi:hypothetical protein|uniref:hypothetical protein n=1 Tax=unclassified Microcoleus TaxID=2642155 RepID=UPI002FD2191E